MDWTDEYRAAMRTFMADYGRKVDVIDPPEGFTRQNPRYSWLEDDETSVYGWVDYDALQHTRPATAAWPGDGCHWVVPEGARLYERTYSQFRDTGVDNDNEVGINVAGCHCACGKYTEVILRYTGSLAEVMTQITGTPGRAEVVL